MIRICENVKMFDRPPLLEEPFAQTLSEKNWGTGTGNSLRYGWFSFMLFWIMVAPRHGNQTRRRIAFDMFSGNDILLWPLPFGFIWYKFKET